MEEPSEPAPPDLDPMANVLVGGRYRLVERIGSGGMGVVWSARDEMLQRRVAVKELRHGWGGSERALAEGRERSFREARAAAALNHPNIVAVYDIVEHGRRPWIVMELVIGRSLKDVVAEDGPLSVERSVAIALDLLWALQAAHDAGITHRDVKPANVLISDADEVRLTDFGLATMPDTETLTETGTVLGTLGYLAPEQAKGEKPGPPADVFGLAATLYYAIEGVGPFHRDGYLPMLVAYTRHEIRAPQRAGALASVLLRLLAADPAKRPSVEQAREWLRGVPVRKSVLSRRAILVGGAVTAVAAVGGAGLWPSRRSITTQRHEPAGRVEEQTRIGGPIWQQEGLSHSIMAGSTLIGRDRQGDVEAVDAETGSRRWGTGFSGTWKLRGGIDEASILIELHDSGGTLTYEAYDLSNGKMQWVVDSSPPGLSRQTAIAGGVLCVHQDRRGKAMISGTNLRSPADKWSVAVGPAGTVQGLWGDGDSLYIATVERSRCHLHAVNAQTGERVWTVLVPQLDSAQAEVAASAAVPYATGGTSDADPLASLTTVDVLGGPSSKIVVLLIRARQKVFAGQTAGLTAVDAVTGRVRWRNRNAALGNAASASGRLLASAASSTALYEIDPISGKTMWEHSSMGFAERLHLTQNTVVTTNEGESIAYRLL